jgi:hypothetical protein
MQEASLKLPVAIVHPCTCCLTASPQRPLLNSKTVVCGQHLKYAYQLFADLRAEEFGVTTLSSRYSTDSCLSDAELASTRQLKLVLKQCRVSVSASLHTCCCSWFNNTQLHRHATARAGREEQPASTMRQTELPHELNVRTRPPQPVLSQAELVRCESYKH